MYSIQETTFGSLTKIEILSEGEGEMVSFVPERGATVLDLLLNNGQETVNVLAGPADYDELMKDKTFAGTVLAPWPNRVANAVYKFNDKTFVLPINEKDRRNALHGLVFDKNFTVVHKETSSNMASVTMHFEYEGDYEGYPFDFLLELTYNLSSNGFEVELSVENIFASEMPLGLGFHPYLSLGADTIDRYKLALPEVVKYPLNEQMIPKGEPMAFEHFAKAASLKGHDFDDVFKLMDEKSRKHSVVLSDPKTNTALEIWMEGGKDKFSYLQIYTPPDRKSIAIEPMTCNINAFNNKQGLQVLKPDDILELNFGIRLVK